MIISADASFYDLLEELILADSYHESFTSAAVYLFFRSILNTTSVDMAFVDESVIFTFSSPLFRLYPLLREKFPAYRKVS